MATSHQEENGENDSSSLSSSSLSDEEERLEDIPEPLRDLLLSDVDVSGRELGAGSYSSVVELSYKGMICAGKRLHRTLYDQGIAIGPEILERFGVECELLSQLRHSKIVQFLGLYFEETSDVPVLVLEYMPYSLSDCIERYGQLPKEISFSILHDVSLGVHYLHSQSPAIIHRDLTANNILLTPNMAAKISDLGMAKILNIAPAQMTRRMTVCPGTISYMPPEALTSNPQYDTKLDCFSYGVLTTHIFCGEWPIASEYLQPDPKNPGHLYPLTEVQRREKYLKRLGEDHPMLRLVKRCLKNLPSERPSALEIVESTKQVLTRHPASFENRIEMLNQIRADRTEKEQLSAEVEELRQLLHEREHVIESLKMAHGLELEKLREKVTRLEQTRALHEVQLHQLQTENSRLQLLLASKREELEVMRKREKTLSNELVLANTKLEEKAAHSLEKLKNLQEEITRQSREREAALKGLAGGEVEGALRLSLGGQRGESAALLADEYEEFFLNNADDIAELLVKSCKPDSPNAASHFKAQQLVCSMIQYCYDQCKSRVMSIVTERLHTLFSVCLSPAADCVSSLHDLSIAYGLLVQEGLDSQGLCDQLCQEIFPQFLEKHGLRLTSRSTEASLRHHMTHACKLTLELVSTWPPLIVTKPKDFQENWHDREYQYWEKGGSLKGKSGAPRPLLYTRPVLFKSYKGEVGAKGWVGNRDKEVSDTTVTKNTSNHRVSSRMSSRKSRSGK